VLGHPGEVEWSLEPDGLRVRLPENRASEFGVTVSIEVAPEQAKARRTGFYL
jgi:hypothetical protein